MTETQTRLREERIRLNLSVNQIWRLVQAGNYDLSETTVRRFYTDDENTPTQHTIDVLSAVTYGTARDDYDPTQAHRYFKECAEMRLSFSEVQKKNSDLEAQCFSLAERLRLYEEAIGYYRRQLETQMAMNMKLLDMVADHAKSE